MLIAGFNPLQVVSSLTSSGRRSITRSRRGSTHSISKFHQALPFCLPARAAGICALLSFSLKLDNLGVSSWMEQSNFFLLGLNLGFYFISSPFYFTHTEKFKKQCQINASGCFSHPLYSYRNILCLRRCNCY